MIRHFSSISAMALEAKRLKAFNQHGKPSWYGGEEVEDTLRLSQSGDRSLVSEAESLISKLETQIEAPRRIWERAPVGVYCAVPDVLAGLPTPMRRIRETGDEHSPISIYVRPNANASIDAKTLRKRGTAILALGLALSRVRPISLYWYFVGDGYVKYERTDDSILITRIETAPLDLASACYALTSAGLYRRVGMGLCEKLNGFQGLTLISDSRGEEYIYSMVPDPKKCLVIGTAREGDPLLTDPVSWLNAQIHKFTAETQDAPS